MMSMPSTVLLSQELWVCGRAINFIDQTKTNEQTVEEKVAPELTDQDRKTRSQRKLIKALLWGGAIVMAAITAYVIYGACMLLM